MSKEHEGGRKEEEQGAKSKSSKLLRGWSEATGRVRVRVRTIFE